MAAKIIEEQKQKEVERKAEEGRVAQQQQRQQPPPPPSTPTVTRPPYYNLFNRVFKERLHQPGDISESVVLDAINAVSSRFQSEYKKIYNKPPTQEEIDNFVGDAITPGYAAQVIVGDLSGSQIMTGIVKPYLSTLPPPPPPPETTKIEEPDLAYTGLSEKIKNLYDIGQKETISQLLQNLQEQAIPQRQNIVSEEAALGRLGSPVGAYRLGQFDVNVGREQARGLSDIIGQYATSRIGNELDISKALSTIAMQNREFGQRKYEFGQNLGLQRTSLANQQRALTAQIQNSYLQDIQNQQDRETAKWLGRQAGGSEEPSAFDWASLGVQAIPVVGGTIKTGMDIYKKYQKSKKSKNAQKPVIV